MLHARFDPRDRSSRDRLEAATARMERAIRAHRRRDAFPAGLAALVGVARLLPAGLYDRLLSGLAARPQPRAPGEGG